MPLKKKEVPQVIEVMAPEAVAVGGFIYPASMQREALLKFAEALGSRRSALMRDECGDWRIEGNRGHIYAAPGALEQPHTPGFQIYFGGVVVEKGWLNTKREMAFAKVMQDGDIDGCMFMDRLPTKGEADGHEYKTRCFTILCYLSNCEGGHTEFPEMGVSVKPERGLWLTFFSEYLHTGAPVTQGEKLIFVTWAVGK